MDQQPADSPYHRTLPIGERLDPTPLLEGPLTRFEDVRLPPLAEMLVPEEPRRGVEDPSACPHCQRHPHRIWEDDTWHVDAGWTRMGLPYVGGLAPNEHCRLDDAPPHVLASLGPLMQRLSLAIKQVPGVARVHFSRWGDGSEHVHLWALARPAGMMQGRGAMLAFWDDVLPPLDPAMQEEHLRIVAEALAADGGTAYPTRQ
ncbi:hypothetical protein GGQ22_05715 [Nocardioides sp. zg-579]|uniref:HIT family protein n=1 Tax=Nocardioides marmotae TaxID=2663857 RepID=A0A6I3IVW8_9ACTN|nr:hypothetical protein [Nocardioides marmotae]MCR6030937.1 hypothetical protein [Gordonia jinghuaiqii]MTB94573.1 hypothetical protein [Nocardioides marmotae]QKE01415.1 hypothetical protein HPC71_10270 [Nocardioides marmotae]